MPIFIFPFDYPDNLIVYSGRYRNVSLDPWCVWNSWYDNGLKVILPEVSMLGRIPCYCLLLFLDQKERTSFSSSGHKKPDGLIFLPSFFSTFLRRNEVWRMFWQNWK